MTRRLLYAHHVWPLRIPWPIVLLLCFALGIALGFLLSPLLAPEPAAFLWDGAK